MFGILRPSFDALPSPDRRLFGRVYCNLCASLGLKYGLHSRMLLVHDLCTIGWLWAEEADLPYRSSNCLRGGVSQVEAPGMSPLLQFMAAMSAYSLGVKYRDDLEDGDTWPKSMATSMYQKAFRGAEMDLAASGFDVAAVEKQLVRQRELEAQGERELLRVSDPTAEAYSLAIEHTRKIKACPLPLESLLEVGRVLGRCVYLHDQLTDYRRDWGRSFNPLHDSRHESQGPSVMLRRRVQVFVHEQLEQLATITEDWPVILRRRLAAVAGHMAQLFGVSRKSVTLYAVCCIPCGDGAVAVDDKDCGGCMTTLGCCMCACMCCSMSRGC